MPVDGRRVPVGVVEPHAGRLECPDHDPLGEAGLGEGEPLAEGAALGGLPHRVAPHVDVEDRCHVLGSAHPRSGDVIPAPHIGG